jgi:2,3-bisphosphoglycerate-dependent phosphoglycerate mutase
MSSRAPHVLAAVIVTFTGLATHEAAAQQPAPPQAQAAAQSQTGTLRIYLARHGETEGNRLGRAQGWTDTPLNETGREQAAALAGRLKGVQFDAIYSSTLSRSRETAQAVAGERNVISLPDLREANLGRFEDLPIGDPALKNRPRDGKNPEDGESREQFFERLRGAITQIRNAHASGGTILVVGHAGANQQILRALLDLTPQQSGQILQSNDELYMIEIHPGNTPRIWKFIPETNLKEL